ncbi:IS4 family transposase [Streptomyces olivoreticuli]
MRHQCATTTITRTLILAAGLFAPGHLGELTQHLPFELVDAVLTETGTTEHRLRALPSRVGVYFVIALALFPAVGYALVWDKLTAALKDAGVAVASPSEKALRDLRRRLGERPLKALFTTVAGPVARPTTPGVRYRCWRTVAFDGCSSIRVPDADRNRGWLGRLHYRLAWAGYPTVRLMALVETGSRALLAADFGSTGTGETAYAKKLLGALNATMLVLGDRAFDANDLIKKAAATGAQLLIRARSTRVFRVVEVLPDGSYLTVVAGVRLRVIDAEVTVTLADGTEVGGRYRLITTLLDCELDPAEALIRLYRERWEVESAYFALRHTLMEGLVLRSKDPFGVRQELRAALTLYQLLRRVMMDAAESAAGMDPDCLSFTVALQAARDSLVLASNVLPGEHAGLVGAIGTAVLENTLPPRRSRISVRKVKSPVSRYHARPKGDTRPQASTSITAITTMVHHGGMTPATVPRDTEPCLSHMDQVLAILGEDPKRCWHGRDLARLLGQTNLNSFCVRLSQWLSQGLFHKAGPALYTLDDQHVSSKPPTDSQFALTA